MPALPASLDLPRPPETSRELSSSYRDPKRIVEVSAYVRCIPTNSQVRLTLPGLQPLASASFVAWGDVPRPLDVYAIAAHAHEEEVGRQSVVK